MNEEDIIETAANEIITLRSSGATPILTLEYGSGLLDDLMDYFEDGEGIHTSLIAIDGKSGADIEIDLDTVRESFDFLDEEVIVFVSFRPNDSQLRDALSIAEEFDGHCVLVKEVWKQTGIEVAKL